MEKSLGLLLLSHVLQCRRALSLRYWKRRLTLSSTWGCSFECLTLKINALLVTSITKLLVSIRFSLRLYFITVLPQKNNPFGWRAAGFFSTDLWNSRCLQFDLGVCDFHSRASAPWRARVVAVLPGCSAAVTPLSLAISFVVRGIERNSSASCAVCTGAIPVCELGALRVYVVSQMIAKRACGVERQEVHSRCRPA